MKPIWAGNFYPRISILPDILHKNKKNFAGIQFTVVVFHFHLYQYVLRFCPEIMFTRGYLLFISTIFFGWKKGGQPNHQPTVVKVKLTSFDIISHLCCPQAKTSLLNFTLIQTRNTKNLPYLISYKLIPYLGNERFPFYFTITEIHFATYYNSVIHLSSMWIGPWMVWTLLVHELTNYTYLLVSLFCL